MIHAEQNSSLNLPLEELLADDVPLADTHAARAAHARARLASSSGRSSTPLLEEREVDPRTEFVAADRPGFWEQNGYHNDADSARGALLGVVIASIRRARGDEESRMTK